jgi:hypothetical protein
MDNMSNIVNLIVTDSKIWNRDQAILDIINAITKFKSVVINFNLEGPCCRSLGLDDLLDSIIKHCGVDPSVVTIVTGNTVTSSKFTEQKNPPLHIMIDRLRINSSVSLDHTPTKRFGLFVSRSNWQRLGVASHLYTKYRDVSTMTYHYNHSDDYHRNHFGLEELLIKHPEDSSVFFEFVNQLPIVVDHRPVDYPINYQRTWDITDLYNDIFCDIVCETFFNGNTFFITEKTLRPILCCRPFIIQGPKHFIKNLHQLGFKTFNDFWDESYDSDPTDFKYTAIKENINWIGSQTSETISEWFDKMKPILIHNYNVLQTLTKEKISNTKFISDDI